MIDQVDQSSIDQNLKGNVSFNENARGPVVQFGMDAAFARRRSRVQIPPGPPRQNPVQFRSKRGFKTIWESEKRGYADSTIQ